MIISKLGNTICRENRKWLILRLFREHLPTVNTDEDFKEKTINIHNIEESQNHSERKPCPPPKKPKYFMIPWKNTN